jgi:hypothetical protein
MTKQLDVFLNFAKARKMAEAVEYASAVLQKNFIQTLSYYGD